MTRAVFACYFCREVFIVTSKHFCQVECDKQTALHRDICQRCERKIRSQLEPQVNALDIDSA